MTRKRNRPRWDEYFLKLAMLASERATCPRMHCGCVLVKNRFVVATGYNGSLPGQQHCYDEGCILENGHCVRTLHAEMNALLQALKHGVSTVGATAYITTVSCTNCAKALVGAGIERVVVFSDFHDTRAEQIFIDSKIEFVRQTKPSNEIDFDLLKYPSARAIQKTD